MDLFLTRLSPGVQSFINLCCYVKIVCLKIWPGFNVLKSFSKITTQIEGLDTTVQTNVFAFACLELDP